MRELQINRVYRHFKGDYYLVVDIAYNSETKDIKSERIYRK